MHSKLIVLRGNSGSGKSTVARAVRGRYGRGCALVEQDYLRRTLLREHDFPGGTTPALIEATCRVALGAGHHVVLEGILHAALYGSMLRSLMAWHPGESRVFYLDVPFEETVRRHGMRPQAGDFTAEEMRDWYVAGDVLGVPGERVVPETSTLEETVAEVFSILAREPATGACPARCDRCRA